MVINLLVQPRYLLENLKHISLMEYTLDFTNHLI